jgi:WNK lysine deficient protein kinase
MQSPQDELIASPIESCCAPQIVVDPSNRFERSNELLGRGASKEVYKAFDREEGMEVAWNQLKVDHLSEQSAAKIISEIQILTQLDNENIIKFYHSWVRRNSAGSYDVFFITELMTSGTLKNYLQKTKGALKLKIVKNWCRQILRALQYLHNRTPPIIHRDLKCDNVFINGNNGQAKLGDFGLAVLKDREMLTSVLGTPEFMAPELYDGKPATPYVLITAYRKL